jgi:hypothetical protein
MKPTTLLAIATVTIGVAFPALSRDDRLKMPIHDAMETTDAKEKLSKDVKLFFGDQKYPTPVKTMGTFTSNKKTNFANKSDKQGCERAFLSAALALQARASKEGGNAVVHIVSVYKNEELRSDTEYECGAGSLMGGVALQGQVVKLP